MSEFLSLASAGQEAVEDTWRRVVPSARIERADPGGLRLTWTSISMEAFTVIGYDLRATVDVQIDPDDQVIACRNVSRSGWSANDQRELDPHQPWLAIDGPTRARWEGRGEARAFVFDRPFAERYARQLTGDDRLVLRATDGAPIDARGAAQWESTFRHVSSTFARLQDADAATAAMVETELRRHALQMTLAVFGSSFLDAVGRTGQRQAAPRTLRRALAYIDAHAHTPITIDDVATASGISTRGLQLAFRRGLGVTPTEYLRDARLAGAHADLEDGTYRSVLEVARRWGFSSASRFARYYREAYGRSPSQTLRG
jgi:AraC-like DNA-binding protein